MRVLTVASAKGGSGKTTIASALAVRASKESACVAMIDLNADQGNLTGWWLMRGEPLNPRLISDIENVIRDVDILRHEGFEWLIIDTPPHHMDLIEASILVSDFVLIPVKTSIFDVAAIDAVVEMCEERKRPFAFDLNDLDNRFKTMNKETIEALKSQGPVCKTTLSHRQPYILALTNGKAGSEIDKSLAKEIDGLWKEIKKLAAFGATIKPVEHADARR